MASVRYVENEIAKEISRLRKQSWGKGANKTAVSIQDGVMFIRISVEYPPVVASLFGFITSKMLEEEYYIYLRSLVQSDVAALIQRHVPDACIKDMHIKMDIVSGYEFVILIFTDDIEKLIRQGKYNKPDPLMDGPDREKR